MVTPFDEWYMKNYEAYSSNLKVEVSEMLKDTKVKIFIGTWCGDTKYLFPKFIKIWHQLGLSDEQLEIVGVHRNAKHYKQGPNGETEGYNIHRVPTFIFERNGKEINRIVERTVFDLETDLKLIANNQPYQPRYKAVDLVAQALDTLSSDSLQSELITTQLKKKIAREISSESELNTYAYVLFFTGEIDKAEFVFKLNKMLFPYDPYILHGYGKVLMENNKYEEAKIQLQESLRIEPDNTKAISYLANINEQLNAAKKTDE